MNNLISKNKKRKSLRYNEYYDFQDKLDELFKASKENKVFRNLYELIIDENNIKLAYRTIKANKGSKTKGVNGHTIADIEKLTNGDYVSYIRQRLEKYNPHKVRRVYIPKANGKMRPLGIPTIEDRIIQQCIKQVLEPVCEAKFYNHSYGFRPNRSTHHAIARCYHLINQNQLTYVVDVDIKSFFDNVDHGKLLKQMWHLGIQDKRVISIISKMLNAEVQNEKSTGKGTPQGGILSPLLSNIVLNELDWWVSNQWENVKLKHDYSRYRVRRGKNTLDLANKYTAQRKTKLKEMFIVRYADDFKIFCRNYNDAVKIRVAVEDWLKTRLNLEVSEDKTKIINLKKNYSEFLGIKLKARMKNKKWRVKSHIKDAKIVEIKKTLREQIKVIQKSPTVNTTSQYNAILLGLHNYFGVATHSYNDFAEINFSLLKCLHNRLKKKGKRSKYKKKNDSLTIYHTETFNKLYKHHKGKKYYIAKNVLFPISGIKMSPPMNFMQEITPYTKEGRMMIHDNLKVVSPKEIQYLLRNPIKDSIELNDNRISLYVAQKGLDAVTDEHLVLGEFDTHHKKPVHQGGKDNYKNLTLLNKDTHILVHATKEETIIKYLSKLNLDNKQLSKLNKLRKLVGNNEIKL